MRISISLVAFALAFALAGLCGEATAQPYPPLLPGDYYPAPPTPYPPLLPQPYVYRDAGRAPVQPYDPGYDEDAYGNPPGPYSPPARPYFVPPDRGEQFPRPPANVGGGRAPADPTGAAGYPPAPNMQGPDRATMMASLPPDYQPEGGPARELPPQLRRQLVAYVTSEPAGTIIIDTPHTYLYLVLGPGSALRYGIGVGREGFTWSGTERVSRMTEWPDWHPPKEMIERQPYLPRFMAGGDGNPLGARALYLGGTLYRIHGTNQPSTIGHFVSSGCIRLTNDDIADLYSRVGVGSRVVVLPGAPRASAARGPVAR